ncbi:excalibur calcium-binding domain-containing protein, partial [Nocardioides sp.]
ARPEHALPVDWDSFFHHNGSLDLDKDGVACEKH